MINSQAGLPDTITKFEDGSKNMLQFLTGVDKFTTVKLPTKLQLSMSPGVLRVMGGPRTERLLDFRTAFMGDVENSRTSEIESQAIPRVLGTSLPSSNLSPFLNRESA